MSKELTARSRSRRQVLKTSAVAGAVVLTSGVNDIDTVVKVGVATESGEVELHTDAEVPQDAGIQVTVDEYAHEDDETPNATAVRDIENGAQTYVLDELSGYETVDVQKELGTDGDSAELSPLVLEIPGSSDDDGEGSNTEGGDDDSLPVTIFGIELPDGLSSWIPFGGTATDDEDDVYDSDPELTVTLDEENPSGESFGPGDRLVIEISDGGDQFADAVDKNTEYEVEIEYEDADATVAETSFVMPPPDDE